MPRFALRFAVRFAAIFVAALCVGCALPDLSGSVRIVRDEWGVPHIFSRSDEGACFGLGYAQAEDRLGEMMKNYRRAEGSMAAAFGAKHIQEDMVSLLSRHAEISRENYGTLRPKTRALMEAFIAGVNAYMAEHPDKKPEWAIDPQPWHIVALGRYIISGWPIGDAQDDLGAAGIQFGSLPYLGSNEWLVGPSRSASGHVIALIDPHLSWYDQFRFFECRLYGKELAFSGFSIVGSNLPTLGHNKYVSIAMTTGSSDTADVYEETLDKDQKKYQYDGEWRDLEIRKFKIAVKQEDGTIKDMEIPIFYSHHGPIVAIKDGKGYAMANPYLGSIGLGEQTWDAITAKNLADSKRALAKQELMGQNVMIGTVQGDIYYQRTGKVPIRPEGVDPAKPIPGNTKATEWLGLHPPEDLVQIENPPQGYMQNCNTSPVNMMEDSPLRLANYRPYIYGTDERPPDQRAAAALHLLKNTAKMTSEQAIEIAMSDFVLGADLWQKRLEAAFATANPGNDIDALKLRELIKNWDLHSRAESLGATAYKYWKLALPEDNLKDRNGNGPGPNLTDQQCIDALKAGAAKLKSEHGSVEVPYGKIHRVGRRGAKRSYPVGGGSRGGDIDKAGMTTKRAIGFFDKGPDGTVIGERGQTSTQIVVLSRPPKSWTVMPTGGSDDPASPHFDDQAEKLYSAGKMKSTYFMDKKALKRVQESEKTLKYRKK